MISNEHATFNFPGYLVRAQNQPSDSCPKQLLTIQGHKQIVSDNTNSATALIHFRKLHFSKTGTFPEIANNNSTIGCGVASAKPYPHRCL